MGARLPYHVFVFASEKVEGKIKERGIQFGHQEIHLSSRGQSVAFWPVVGHPNGTISDPMIRILRGAAACTYQAIIAGVELVVSRAGGATVNDCLACAVPMLLVPEPGHWQVEAIRTAAVDEGFAVPLPYSDFVRDPVGALDSRIVPLMSLWSHMNQRMKGFSRSRETAVAQQLLNATGL